MLPPHSQKHVLCLLFCILTPQLLLPRRIWKRDILRMGTARICHICIWGQRRKSTRSQLREGRKRPSRSTPGASQGPKKGGDQGPKACTRTHTHNHEILLGQCWTGMSHREMPVAEKRMNCGLTEQECLSLVLRHKLAWQVWTITERPAPTNYD